MDIFEGDVWLVNFPLEEDPTQSLPRPVIVLNVERFEVLSVKVTKTEPRNCDDFDTPIVFWQEANLRYKSTARVKANPRPFIKRSFLFVCKYLEIKD